MEKQELIDKQALIDELMKIPGVGSNSDALKTIKRFPSYEPQKVKVKQFVADWYEEHKHNLSESLWEFTADVHEKTLVSGAIYTEFESWFIAQPRVYEFITRMGKGYEIEEEPKWVVKIEDNGSAYFVDFFDELQPHLVCGLSGEVMRFDSEDKANAIVTLIECGTVEKVQV